MNPTTVAIVLVVVGYLAAVALIVLGLTTHSRPSIIQEGISVAPPAELDRDDLLRRASYRIAVAMVYVGVLVAAFYPMFMLAMGVQAAAADLVRWQRGISNEHEASALGIVLAALVILAILAVATVGVRVLAQHFAVRPSPALLIGAGLVLLGLLTMLVWVVVAAPAAN